MKKKHFWLMNPSLYLTIFVLILIPLIVGSGILVIDELISSWIVNNLWGSQLDSIFIFLGNYSRAIMIFVLFAAISLLYFKERKKESLVFLTALVSGFIIEKIIGFVVQRPRPFPQLIEKLSYSFPSGHATFAIILFSLLIYFYKDEIRNNFYRKTFISTSILLILIVGFSRIYLNTHWFTDVLGGFFLGFFVVSAAILFISKNEKII